MCRGAEDWFVGVSIQSSPNDVIAQDRCDLSVSRANLAGAVVLPQRPQLPTTQIRKDYIRLCKETNI